MGGGIRAGGSLAVLTLSCNVSITKLWGGLNPQRAPFGSPWVVQQLRADHLESKRSDCMPPAPPSCHQASVSFPLPLSVAGGGPSRTLTTAF